MIRRHRLLALLCTVAALTLWAGGAAQADVEPVELEEVTFADAELVIAGPEGEKRYTPAELEAFDTYRMVTRTPWRPEAAVFHGPLLSDVLGAHGLADASAVRVTAEDDFMADIPREVWTGRPVLIATRVDGRAHTRRARGPLQLVYPMSDEPKLGSQAFQENWVWMISRIEPLP